MKEKTLQYITILLERSRIRAGYALLQKKPELRNGVLTGLNLLLLFILFVQFNLAGIFAVGYEAADILLDLQQADVRRITIRDPDLAGSEIQLTRQEALPSAQWHTSNNNFEQQEKSFWQNFYEHRPTQYRWRLLRAKKPDAQAEGETDAKTNPALSENYAADIERMAELFQALAETRRYYAVPRTPAKEQALQMRTDADGNYSGLQIEFMLESGAAHTLYVGRSGKASDETYVRLNDETQIYLVRANLRSRSGNANLDYFRDRSVVGAQISRAQIVGIQARRMDNQQPIFQANHNGKEWLLNYPPLATIPNGKLRQDAVDSFIKDVLDWKAKAFPRSAPSDLDPKYVFDLILNYKEAGQVAEKQLILKILGRKGYSDYYVRLPDASLREISSVYLEDVLQPQRKFIEKQKEPLK